MEIHWYLCGKIEDTTELTFCPHPTLKGYNSSGAISSSLIYHSKSHHSSISFFISRLDSCRGVLIQLFKKQTIWNILPSDWRRAKRWAVLNRMRLFPRWEEEWKTLTVRRNSQGDIESTPDEFSPHGLVLGRLALPCDRFLNLQDPTSVSKVSSNGTLWWCDEDS